MAATSQNKTLFEDYDGFCEKFQPKKTTDDCYTPPLVYEAVAEWTAQEYGLDRSHFVRPFYPGGDYRNFDYSGDRIVVDNPPFSILQEIVNFYTENGIPFLLFAPTLVGLVRYADKCTVFPTGVDVTYENGAVVLTSFCTNLDPHEIRARTVPALYEAVAAANDANLKEKRREIPKYEYPPDVITAAQMYPFARFGIEFVLRRAESHRIGALDSQRAAGKSIFGRGWLISEREKAEREKAEREKAEREKAEREKAAPERLVCDRYDGGKDIPEAVISACFSQIAHLAKMRENLGEQLAQIDADLEALRLFIGGADG
jgi:hypothetical protein